VSAINNLNLTGDIPNRKGGLGTGHHNPFPHLLNSIHSQPRISESGDDGGNGCGNEFNLFTH